MLFKHNGYQIILTALGIVSTFIFIEATILVWDKIMFIFVNTVKAVKIVEKGSEKICISYNSLLELAIHMGGQSL